MPKISVIIPVYNSEKHLNMCLESILGQTMQDFEIIIVNDGSTDGSQAIIDDYKARYDDKITAIYQENAGQASARNKGLEKVCGEYIIFIDSDDYIEPETFEVIYNKAETSNLDIVCFIWRETDRETEILHSWNFRETPVDVRYILNTPSPCNKLFRSWLFKENDIRFVENHIYEDLALIPTVALYTDKIGFIDNCLYNYTISNTSTMRQKSYNPKLASIYFAMDCLEKAFGNTKYQEELEFLYIDHLLHYASLRYLEYPDGDGDIKKISDIIKNKYPKFYKNKYFKEVGIKEKIFCFLAYTKNIFILRLIFNRKDAFKCLIRKS